LNLLIIALLHFIIFTTNFGVINAYTVCLHCFDTVGWVAGRASGLCKKTEWWVAGIVIYLEQDADLHMAQLMPLPLTHLLLQ